MAEQKQQQKGKQNKVFEKRGVVKKSDDMSAWYTDVILNSQMADYSPVRGSIVYRPLSYSIWESVQGEMNARFRVMGIENCYFPLFIPESLLKREAQHVRGFAPELAVVTIGGGEELKEKLIVRPTSETIMYEMYAKWVHSHRDLPILLNQWNNVVRWEKRTYFFLRGMEFLWQEAHTAHATHEEAWQQVLSGLDAYAEIYEDVLAIPVTKGRKSESEKFAGADTTTTVEAMMPDGKALQGGTSHDLGQNFSKAFNIAFQDATGQKAFVWQTSFGYSTRALGALVMVHGDDQGLVLPPKVAPIQVVVLPIGESNMVSMMAKNIVQDLQKIGIRVKLDTRDQSLGYKRNDWELKGVPVRIELGEKELAARKVSVAVRVSSEKLQIGLDSLASELTSLLANIQDQMLAKARAMTKSLTSTADTYDEFKKIMETKRGFIHAFWCEDKACEEKIKEETKASTRCLPLDAKEENGTCIVCGNPAKHRWLFAQAY
ncbi:MAG TPA: proline--tRNA ligase [Candidatus Saccharimonadia bacterium]|nr:proline--tRNA ligase [Candidatus Saccharimonadia bacterium]